VKGIVQIVDHTIVHRAAELRMRMQDDRNRRITVLLRVVAPFKAPFGSGEDDFGHCDP